MIARGLNLATRLKIQMPTRQGSVRSIKRVFSDVPSMGPVAPVSETLTPGELKYNARTAKLKKYLLLFSPFIALGLVTVGIVNSYLLRSKVESYCPKYGT